MLRAPGYASRKNSRRSEIGLRWAPPSIADTTPGTVWRSHRTQDLRNLRNRSHVNQLSLERKWTRPHVAHALLRAVSTRLLLPNRDRQGAVLFLFQNRDRQGA